MQRIQRKFGTFLPRTADEAQVGAMLHEFESADKMLSVLIEGAKQWRDAWSDILKYQLGFVETYDTVCQPLGSNNPDVTARPPVEPPEDVKRKVRRLHELYTDLKADMEEELRLVNSRLIEPATAAKQHIQPLKKVIKAREDKKLDYERFKNRVENAHKKTNRSDRENQALEKHEADLARATEQYELADEELRNRLPYITAAAMNLLPNLLANQIMIQNSLLGNFYTILVTYSEEHGFSSPPLELPDIVRDWDAVHTPLRTDIETNYRMIRDGKAVHQPMNPAESPAGSISGFGIRNRITNHRKGSNGSSTPRPPHLQSAESTPPLPSPPPLTALNASKPTISSSNGNSHAHNTLSPPDAFAPGRRLSATSASSDYFTQTRPRPSSSTSAASSSTAIGTPTSNSITSAAAMAAAVASKKKKPPPPPPPAKKKLPSYQAEYVTAMYDFAGEAGAGDLSFREGDRIRVLKKTASSQDWWEGELDGVRGSFPANYCR